MLTRIDDLTRGDHRYLEHTDACYYFGEYTSRQGFAFSETNQLISNFKKSVEFRGRPAWRHKQRAVTEVAALFRRLTLPNGGDGIVLVPAPPSKAPNDPLYDDRMYEALTQEPSSFDVRKLVVQTASRLPAHFCEDGGRPRVADLVQAYTINEAESSPPPRGIFVCDDVLTSGTTFKAMQCVLQRRFPGIPVGGIFVARRVWGADGLLF